MSGQVSNPAISISQPLIREFPFTAQPLITKPLNFIFRLLSSFQSDGKEGRLSLRQLHCSVVRWFKVHPKKNVLMCFDGGFESSIPWHRSHRQSDQSWKLCQLSTRPLTACSLAFRMLQTCLGCQIKDALLQLPSVFLAFLVPTPPIATFLNQESDPSLGDCNFHLSSRWLHNMHNDIIMT